MSKMRRALSLALMTLAGAAAPASADPVVAGPATPDELAVIAVGGGLATANASRSDAVALHRVSTADGAYRGRIAFPSDTITKTGATATANLRQAALRRSGDGRFLTFGAANAPLNTNYAETNTPTLVRVAADGTWANQPLGTGYMNTIGQSIVAAMTIDGSRSWLGFSAHNKSLATFAPGDTALTQIAGGAVITSSADLVDGSLVTTGNAGVSRLPGGLPTALDTTTPPQLFIPLTFAFDSVFVDTDGVPGADTAYITRGTRGLWKFALEGGAWKSRGSVPGSYAWVTARAVAGAVEVYLTHQNNGKVLKLVDTAQIGGQLTTTGATTLAYAPARGRFAGLAFAPGTGFPVDTTPYPATPPVLSASATSVATHVGATPKASIQLEAYDPNTTDVTITATSSNQTVLPNDKIEISGTGVTRTVTFDAIAAGSANVTLTATADGESVTVTVALAASAPAPEATSHYYSGLVDISATIDLGGDFFLGISDEVNTVHLFRKGVSGAPLASFSDGFPGGETDFEGAVRFGDTIAWSGSHGNNRSGSARPERRFVAFTTITGTGEGVDLAWRNEYTRLWEQWKTWDATNGHGLGANKLKFNTATVPGLLPNAPNGFNVEGLTMAPGSTSTAWFGMRAPTITGDDGVERALILPVTNFDKLTSNAVNAEFGAPILLDLGGRSIREIVKNGQDQYLISAGTGDTDDSVKGWALYTWDGNPANAPQMVKALPTDEGRIGAWEGIAEVPANLGPGSRVLMTADSGDTGIGKSYGQYVTLDAPVAGPAIVGGVAATAKPGAVDITWNAAEQATRYYVKVTAPDGTNAPGSPKFVTGTSTALEGLTAGTEYTVHVRAENVAARSANSVAVKATPTQGARVVTTTGIEFVGFKVSGESHKLVATVSDPNATGKVRFYNGANQMQDSYLTDPVPGTNYNEYRREFPVVNGKAEIDITNQVNQSRPNLQARFISANEENFVSSNSPVIMPVIESTPRIPGLEILSVTGDRKVGGRVAIKVKLKGFKPTDLHTANPVQAQLLSRLNNAANGTRIVGEGEGSSGYVTLDATTGEGTFTTTTLAAGEHRITAHLGNYNASYAPIQADHVPVRIVAAADPVPEPPVLKRPRLMLTVNYGPLTTDPVTLTARVSDPSLAGSVQFMNGTTTNVGTPVPVVNGVATYTISPANVSNALYMARFEPTTDRASTTTPVALPVSILRFTTPGELPLRAASTTTLAVTGERVAGATQTATVNVVSQGTDAFAPREINGYAEVFDGATSLGFAPVIAGKAELQFTLPVGVHALRAKYIPGDSVRGNGSESAVQDVAVVVKADTNAPVGGDVPATLALTLGAPASFEPFVPGVAKEYTAATSATVISTAGDAALTVSEPGHLTNGAFSLASPLRVEFSKAAWTGPVSNESVDVAFKQTIGANDPLRTGTYSKTLTFTLSTTNP